MSLTTRDANLIPEIIVEVLTAVIAGRRALHGSKAVTVRNTMPAYGLSGAMIEGGDKIIIPQFNSIGKLEKVPEGMALTPRALSTNKKESTVNHWGLAAEITQWARKAAGSNDPYGEIAKQFNLALQHAYDDEAIIEAGTTTLISDISGLAGDASKANYAAMVRAMQKWGDEKENIAIMVVHSDVGTDMRLMVDAVGNPILKGMESTDGMLPTFYGVPILESDKIVKTGTGASATYDNLILKEGALAIWVTDGPVVLQGQDILAYTWLQALHLFFATVLYAHAPGGTKEGAIRFRTKASVAPS